MCPGPRGVPRQTVARAREGGWSGSGPLQVCSSVSMETAGMFRVTINSLITVFRCHLSLTKDKRRGDEAATVGGRAVSDCCHEAVVMLNLSWGGGVGGVFEDADRLDESFNFI